MRYLTMEAVEIIKESEVVIAFGRISKTAEKLKGEIIAVNRVDEIIKNIDKNKKTAILASGDPCFYGVTEYLKRNGIEIDEIIPGLSSFQYMMAKLKKSWQDAALLSLHGREDGYERALKSRLSVLLTDSKNSPNEISKKLYEMGLRGTIYTGYNLSYDDECIIEKKVGEEIEKMGTISLVVIENEMV
ncbi:precorrin-6y C5,15-methyltransferase (decarboxylating) subunit CbiE [Fervidicella metallireducens]|uniref:precorrin-6y C5,15-methyltransferase (decarboxylating) subunit CbiE n=1 Tax=Fervidicella metallireducens TaxID=655338 RepID=UPI0005504171|nr:precorrin-6y C5,15-methyltransferase (decarboxylating) subunit CbiE [Fervidicella metallireducens]